MVMVMVFGLLRTPTVLITWICWYNNIQKYLKDWLAFYTDIVLISNINSESVGLKSIL